MGVRRGEWASGDGAAAAAAALTLGTRPAQPRKEPAAATAAGAASAAVAAGASAAKAAPASADTFRDGFDDEDGGDNSRGSGFVGGGDGGLMDGDSGSGVNVVNTVAAVPVRVRPRRLPARRFSIGAPVRRWEGEVYAKDASTGVLRNLVLRPLLSA